MLNDRQRLAILLPRFEFVVCYFFRRQIHHVVFFLSISRPRFLCITSFSIRVRVPENKPILNCSIVAHPWYGMITKQQHGFLARHSTCTQLLECLHDWSIAINNIKSLDKIYIDYSRALDSVVHSKLLLKLKSYDIKCDLFNWISYFFCIIINNGLF